jgi:hypothetical protein
MDLAGGRCATLRLTIFVMEMGAAWSKRSQLQWDSLW